MSTRAADAAALDRGEHRHARLLERGEAVLQAQGHQCADALAAADLGSRPAPASSAPPPVNTDEVHAGGEVLAGRGDDDRAGAPVVVDVAHDRGQLATRTRGVMVLSSAARLSLTCATSAGVLDVEAGVRHGRPSSRPRSRGAPRPASTEPARAHPAVRAGGGAARRMAVHAKTRNVGLVRGRTLRDVRPLGSRAAGAGSSSRGRWSAGMKALPRCQDVPGRRLPFERAPAFRHAATARARLARRTRSARACATRCSPPATTTASRCSTRSCPTSRRACRLRRRHRARVRRGDARGRAPGRPLLLAVGLAPPGLPGVHRRRPPYRFGSSRSRRRAVAALPRLPVRPGARAAHRLRRDRPDLVRRRLGAQRREVALARARADDPRAAAGHPDQRPSARRRRLRHARAVRPGAAAGAALGDLHDDERELGLQPVGPRGEVEARAGPHAVRGRVEGGNLLLNVSPMGDGSLPAEQIERLDAIASWMDRHADAIHDTTPGLEPWQFHGPTTRKGDRCSCTCSRARTRA